MGGVEREDGGGIVKGMEVGGVDRWTGWMDGWGNFVW